MVSDMDAPSKRVQWTGPGVVDRSRPLSAAAKGRSIRIAGFVPFWAATANKKR